MSFQQYTTFEQSQELNECGASQVAAYGSGARYFFKDGIGAQPQDMVWCGATVDFRTQINIPEHSCLRRYSLQEMLHGLMACRAFSVLLCVHGQEGAKDGIGEKDHASLKVFLYDRHRTCLSFEGEGRDPFQAVFEAYKWHLQHQPI